MNSANLQLEKSDSTVEKAEAFQQIWILPCLVGKIDFLHLFAASMVQKNPN